MLIELHQIPSLLFFNLSVFAHHWKTINFLKRSLSFVIDFLPSNIYCLFFPLAKLGHGDFSAANTKVLRMVNTLAVDNEAKQTIEALRTELQKTKERLQAVEELKSQSGISSVPWMEESVWFSNIFPFKMTFSYKLWRRLTKLIWYDLFMLLDF